MCGIVGALTFGEPIVDSHKAIRRAMKAMARRGPDDEGFWTDGDRCALGFRRLAILDLSPAGNQPMVTGDGRYVLAMNGEIYNFRELRKDLEAKGVRFRSTGDAEVALYALAIGGPDALDSFNGMFALAFYDTKSRSLLLARDHAGIKPLYYHHSARGVNFSSRLDTLLGHEWTRDAPISRESLALYLHFGFVPAPHTILQGVRQVEAGTWVRINEAGEVRTHRYFSLPEPGTADLAGREAAEAADAAIGEAVERQMVSDVPVGAFLSGGIDSPLVCAKARAIDPDIVALTIGTNGDEPDESLDATRYADDIGIGHEVYHVAPEESRHLLDDAIDACGEPFADYSIFPTMLLCRHARRRVKVMLAGDGGDELFWGYAGRTTGVLRNAARNNGEFIARQNAAPSIFESDLGSVQMRRQTFLHTGWLDSVFPDMPSLPDDFRIYHWEGGDEYRALQWIRWNEYTGHLARVLDKVDRASMHESLEVRVPLLDRAVIEAAIRTKPLACIDTSEMVAKIPLRDALRRYVREPTTSKRGFHPPMTAWLRGPLRPILEDLILGDSEILGIPLRSDSLREAARRHMAGEEDHSWGLWRLLALRLWFDRIYTPGRSIA